jgi:putative copper export protein
MKPLPREHGLPTKNDLAFASDPLTDTTSEMPRNWAVRFGKRFSTAIGALVAVVATSGWLYLLTVSIRAFVSWL